MALVDLQSGSGEIERELQQILASPAFHGSRRCSDFLQFIVTRTLEGRGDELKERTIASEVFERDPLYDPKTDGVVRVRANEVRKRLAQYYQAAGTSARIRIDLPAGSYIPAFEPIVEPIVAAAPVPPPAAEPPAAELRPRRFGRPLLAVAMLAAVAAVAIWMMWPSRTSAPADIERFWSILTPGTRPVVIGFVSGPTVRLHDFRGVLGKLPGRIDRRRYEIPVTPDLQLGPKVIYEPDGQIAVGDAMAAAAVSRSLGELHKPSVVKAGVEISFTDIRSTPAVLIGAFNNNWALEVNKDLRFNFVRLTTIVDQSAGGKVLCEQRTLREAIVEDCALISRVIQSRTGGPVVTIGGLRHYGTQAGAELVTDPEMLKTVTRLLPSGWERRNVQIVVKTVLTQERPGPAQVVATHVW